MFKPVVGMWLNLWPQNITKKVHVYNQEPIELAGPGKMQEL